MDWIQEPFEVNARVHVGPGAPVVRLRWMFTDRPFLSPGTGCVITNRIWDQDQDTDLPVGQLPLVESNYVQDARWRILPSVWGDHICHPEWLDTGEPWPTTLPPATYGADGIPDCCGRLLVCISDECSTDYANGAKAAQERMYPIDAALTNGTTPVWIRQVALNEGNHVPSWPGYHLDFYPAGEDGPRVEQLQVVADENGNLQFQTRVWDFAGGAQLQETRDATGLSFLQTDGASTGTLTTRIVGGQLVLSGTNLLVSPSVLPPNTSYRAATVLTGAGNVQAGATVIPSGSAALKRLDALNDAFVLSADPAGMVDVRNVDVNVVRVFPPPGEYIGNHALNGAFFLAADGTIPIPLAWRLTRTVDDGTGVARWLADAYYPQGLVGGTVTSVALSTTSAGLTVGGGPITSSGTFTVNLAPDLNALSALSGTNTIYYRSGPATWSAVTFPGLVTFAGGAIDLSTVTVAKGGTGAVTLTPHGLLLGNGTAAVAAVAVGATGKVLTGVTGADPVWADPITSTAGSAALGADVVLSGASGVFAGTGLVAAIPAAGQWQVVFECTGQVTPGTGSSWWISGKLRDTTNGADLANTACIVVFTAVNAAVGFFGNKTWVIPVTTTGAANIELFAARTSGGTFTDARLTASVNGAARCGYRKVGN